jgi:hypothetical protein
MDAASARAYVDAYGDSGEGELNSEILFGQAAAAPAVGPSFVRASTLVPGGVGGSTSASSSIPVATPQSLVESLEMCASLARALNANSSFNVSRGASASHSSVSSDHSLELQLKLTQLEASHRELQAGMEGLKQQNADLINTKRSMQNTHRNEMGDKERKIRELNDTIRVLQEKMEVRRGRAAEQQSKEEPSHS